MRTKRQIRHVFFFYIYLSDFSIIELSRRLVDVPAQCLRGFVFVPSAGARMTRSSRERTVAGV